MTRAVLIAAALLPAVCAFAQETPAPEQPAGDRARVYVCDVEDMIDEGIRVIVERTVKEANESGADAIIFRINTPGGRVDSAVNIADAIQESKATTVAYIRTGMGATSAGALISFACHKILMEPGSTIGAAAPVMASAEGMKPLGEKEVSFMRAKMRALAESRGHNPDIAQAMVDKDIELRGYTDDNGKYVVYAVTRDDEYHEPPPPPAAQPKSPLEEILESSGVETPGAQPPAVVTAPDPERKPAPGTVVFDDGSERVLAAGKLLTLTPAECIKYGVIEQTVENIDDAIAYLGYTDPEIVYIEPLWTETTFRFLTSPTVAGILLLVGLGALYFEVKTPGFGIPGIIGGICLALLFGAHFVLGLTDVIDILLVTAGIILILVELLVLPGFGVAGAAGIVCLLAGIYLALVDFTIPEYSWQYDRLSEVGYSMGLALTLFLIFVAVSWRLFPRTPLYGKLVMRGTQAPDAGYVVQGQAAAAQYIGREGVAASMLRPAGRGKFGSETLMVMTRGDFIAKDTPIVIVEVEGNRYIVDPLKKDAQEWTHA